MLGVVGCEEDSDPTSTGLFNFDTDNPGDNDFSGIDWAVVTSSYFELKQETDNLVYIVPMDDSIVDGVYPYVSNITLTIDNAVFNPTIMEIDGIYLPIWYVEILITEGAEFEFQLDITEINNTVHNYTANLTTVHSTNTFSFPANYFEGETLETSWTLDASNQFQVASAYSEDYSTIFGSDDSYETEISNSLRSFAFPANCVDRFSDYTDYEFSVDQYNQAKNGGFLALSTSTDYKYYYSNKNQPMSKEAHAIRLLKTLGLR